MNESQSAQGELGCELTKGHHQFDNALLSAQVHPIIREFSVKCKESWYEIESKKFGILKLGSECACTPQGQHRQKMKIDKYISGV